MSWDAAHHTVDKAFEKLAESFQLLWEGALTTLLCDPKLKLKWAPTLENHIVRYCGGSRKTLDRYWWFQEDFGSVVAFLAPPPPTHTPTQNLRSGNSDA